MHFSILRNQWDEFILNIMCFIKKVVNLRNAGIILFIAIKLAFPTSRDLEDATATSGFDYEQYKFAQAVNNILLLKRADEDYHDGQNLSSDELINPSLIKFQEISGETLSKICEDFDLNVFIESEGRLIDCRKMRQDSDTVEFGYILQQDAEDDNRIKRDAAEEEIEGSGDIPTDDKPAENIAPPQNVSVSTAIEETKVDVKNSNVEKAQNSTKSTVPKKVSTPTDDVKVKAEKTVELESSTNNNKNDNETQAITVPGPNDKTATTKQDITGASKSESNPEVTKEKSQSISSVSPEPVKTDNNGHTGTDSKTEKPNDAILSTKSNINVTEEVEVKPADTKLDNKDTNVPPMPGKISTSDTGKKESSVKGHDKPEVQRKGKHIIADVEQTEIQEQSSSTNNKESEAIKNPTTKEDSVAKNVKKEAMEEPKTDKSTKKTANNSGIIWFLFGGVVIVGAALIGYKMIQKRRRQRQSGNTTKRTATEPATQTSNSSVREQEMKPLMSEVKGKQNNTAGELRDITESDTANNGQQKDNLQENKNEESDRGDQPSETCQQNETQNGNVLEDKTSEK